MINIAFMASDAVAVPAMRALLESKEVRLKCVVSNPDRPKGRGGKTSPNSAAMLALENNIELMRPEKSPSAECVEWLKSNEVEGIVVMAYGKILRDEILSYGSLPCLNLHGSLLPKYRGASPIETALALGEAKTGVSLMRVVKKMDSGDVCAKIETEISPRETGLSLREKIAQDAAKLLLENLSDWINSRLNFTPQDDALATYARKLTKADMYLDFRKSARELDLRIRAFGCGIVKIGADFVKIGEAYAEKGGGTHEAGTVLECSKDGVLIACSEGVLRAVKLQAPCAKMLGVGDFLNGYKGFSRGLVLESSENEPLLKNL